jgi:hypothetical protein
MDNASQLHYSGAIFLALEVSRETLNLIISRRSALTRLFWERGNGFRTSHGHMARLMYLLLESRSGTDHRYPAVLLAGPSVPMFHHVPSAQIGSLGQCNRIAT